MLNYLIDLFSFSIGDSTYNLFTTPWERILSWISTYQQYNNNQYSTAVRDAYYDLGKLGFMQGIFVIALLILGTWLFYKIAHGFSGWMKFR